MAHSNSSFLPENDSLQAKEFSFVPLSHGESNGGAVARVLLIYVNNAGHKADTGFGSLGLSFLT